MPKALWHWLGPDFDFFAPDQTPQVLMPRFIRSPLPRGNVLGHWWNTDPFSGLQQRRRRSAGVQSLPGEKMRNDHRWRGFATLSLH